MRSDVVEMVVADGVTCVTVRGEFDRRLAERFVLAAVSGNGDVDVDLAEVTLLDSAGLGALAQVIAGLSGGGRKVTVTAASPLVERLIDICGMADLLGLHGCEAAVKAPPQRMHRTEPSRTSGTG